MAEPRRFGRATTDKAVNRRGGRKFKAAGKAGLRGAARMSAAAEQRGGGNKGVGVMNKALAKEARMKLGKGTGVNAVTGGGG